MGLVLRILLGNILLRSGTQNPIQQNLGLHCLCPKHKFYSLFHTQLMFNMQNLFHSKLEMEHTHVSTSGCHRQQESGSTSFRLDEMHYWLFGDHCIYPFGRATIWTETQLPLERACMEPKLALSRKTGQ